MFIIATLVENSQLILHGVDETKPDNISDPTPETEANVKDLLGGNAKLKNVYQVGEQYNGFVIVVLEY
jgi:hypothetical protein